MIHYTQCPVCGGQHLRERETAKDFLSSGESFKILECSHCGLFFTQDVPEEENIGKYYQSENYISHSDTEKGLINKLYHWVRKITLKNKKTLIESVTHKNSGNILDIGSGTGSFLHTMKMAGWTVTGVEPDETAANNSSLLHNISPVSLTEAAGLPSASFDVITMWHVLEHVHGLDFRMRELHRMLRQDGNIFIAVPNHTSYDATRYKADWAAWDVPRHLYHFSPKSMRFLCEKYQLHIVRIVPMWFDSFYVSMLSEKYKNGKGNLLSAALTGFISNLKATANKEKCSSLIYVIQKT